MSICPRPQEKSRAHNSVSYTNATVIVDNEILCNIFHSNVDIERPTDANGADALKEYAILWKATVIRFDSLDDMKMWNHIIHGDGMCEDQ